MDISKEEYRLVVCRRVKDALVNVELHIEGRVECDLLGEIEKVREHMGHLKDLIGGKENEEIQG